MSEVLEYLEQKHMSYNISEGANGPEAIVKICPYCRDSNNHFYINVYNSVFYCHKCQVAGSLFALKAHLGDLATIKKVSPVEDYSEFEDEDTERVLEAHKSLKHDDEVLLYLHDRGFTMDAINYFVLGASVEEGYKWLWMPYKTISGTFCNVKKRRLDKKEFKRWIGRESTLFNENALSINTDHIVICEGETDTIALWGTGLSNVVGVPTGAKGFNPKWTEQLDKYHRIYLAYDNDDTGYEGVHTIASRLGQERCYVVKLPPDVKDVNDYIKQGHNGFDFKRLMSTARLIDVQYVNSCSDELEKYMNSMWIRKSTESNTLVLPWDNLHAITNGFESGDLIVLASRPGVGKTEMAINFLYNYTLRDIPCLLFSLEMRLERLLPRIVARQLQMDSKLVNTFEHMNKAYQQLKNFPLYMAYVYKKPTFDFVADTIRMCVRRYGIRFVVFDNLHFLVRSLRDQVREVSVIVQGFKLLAEELGIPILLIARPRKTGSTIITNLDLKDSADIEGDADIVILLHRENKNKEENDYKTQGIFEPRCLVRVSKCRYASGGDVYLNFKDDTCTVSKEGGV